MSKPSQHVQRLKSSKSWLALRPIYEKTIRNKTPCINSFKVLLVSNAWYFVITHLVSSNNSKKPSLKVYLLNETNSNYLVYYLKETKKIYSKGPFLGLSSNIKTKLCWSGWPCNTSTYHIGVGWSLCLNVKPRSGHCLLGPSAGWIDGAIQHETFIPGHAVLAGFGHGWGYHTVCGTFYLRLPTS